MKRLRRLVRELFWAVTKNMAVGNGLPTQLQSDRKLEVIVDDRGEKPNISDGCRKTSLSMNL